MEQYILFFQREGHTLKAVIENKCIIPKYVCKYGNVLMKAITLYIKNQYYTAISTFRSSNTTLFFLVACIYQEIIEY